MRSETTNTLQIRTPEGVSFSLQLASPVARFFAWVIDLAIVVLLLILFTGLASLIRFISLDLYLAVVALIFFALSIGYGILLEWLWRGQTVGKRVIGLRVMDETGLPLQFRQVVLRNLLRVIDKLPFFYFLGGVTALLSAKSQRLGDLTGGTIVVRLSRKIAPDLEQLLGNKFNSLREHVQLQARLRQSISAEEATIAVQALLRRNDLNPADRLKLFGDLAQEFQSRVPLPEGVTNGLSDEQLVRNIVDILFRNS